MFSSDFSSHTWERFVHFFSVTVFLTKECKLTFSSILVHIRAGVHIAHFSGRVLGSASSQNPATTIHFATTP